MTRAPTPPPDAPLEDTKRRRHGGRSARVVRDVLAATIAELAEVGYAELRIERVAERAGVNKTSIYRRWPSRAELVEEALRARAAEKPPVPDTGTLRGDLLALLRQAVLFAADPQRRGIVRVFQSEGMHPELGAIARALRDEQNERYAEIVRRAVARGELPAGSDAKLIVQLVLTPVHTRILTFGEAVDEQYLESVVSVVLRGALAGGAVPPAVG